MSEEKKYTDKEKEIIEDVFGDGRKARSQADREADRDKFRKETMELPKIPQSPNMPHIHGNTEQLAEIIGGCLIPLEAGSSEGSYGLMTQMQFMIAKDKDENLTIEKFIEEIGREGREKAFKALKENFGDDTATFMQRNFIKPHNDAVLNNDKVTQALVVRKIAIFAKSLI